MAELKTEASCWNNLKIGLTARYSSPTQEHHLDLTGLLRCNLTIFCLISAVRGGGGEAIRWYFYIGTLEPSLYPNMSASVSTDNTLFSNIWQIVNCNHCYGYSSTILTWTGQEPSSAFSFLVEIGFYVTITINVHILFKCLNTFWGAFFCTSMPKLENSSNYGASWITRTLLWCGGCAAGRISKWYAGLRVNHFIHGPANLRWNILKSSFVLVQWYLSWSAQTGGGHTW